MKKFRDMIAALLAVVLIIGAIVAGRVAWATHNDTLVERGRKEMREQLARERDLNARLRNDVALRIKIGIEKGVSDYTDQLQSEQAKRVADDRLTRDRIEGLISADPEYYTNRLCTVPDQMLAERNRIRHNIAVN